MIFILPEGLFLLYVTSILIHSYGASGADLKRIRFIYSICRTWEKASLGLTKLKVTAIYNSLNLICY